MSEDPGACAAPAKEDVSQSICRDFILYKPPEDNPHGLFDEPRKIMLSPSIRKYDEVFTHSGLSAE
jgi:hypothetical protein